MHQNARIIQLIVMVLAVLIQNGGLHPNYAPNRFDTYLPTYDQVSMQIEREAAHFNFRGI